MAKRKRFKQLEAGRSGSPDLSTPIAGPPDNDRITVPRLDESEQKIGGIIIPDTAKEKPQLSKVIAKITGKMALEQTSGFVFLRSSAEAGAQPTPPPVEERRHGMIDDRPREDRWKSEPMNAVLDVPIASILIGRSVSELVGNYKIDIEVLEGEREQLLEGTPLAVNGPGRDVDNFISDLYGVSRAE